VVKILVQVKPSSRENKLIINTDGSFSLKVKAPPIKGRANREIIKWLSKGLNISSKSIVIVKGLYSKEKMIVISGVELNQIIELADLEF
jgi:hypothetical protein